MNSRIRVRFAPSPTGYLHVGGARTAIFNWLFARHEGGSFFLRIEDTDRERSNEDMTRAIYDGLHWLGITWDDTPVMQSQRGHRHREEALRLAAEGKAYPCYCQPDELERKREESIRRTGGYRYDGACRSLSNAERDANEQRGVPKALRFRIPDGVTQFFDIVHGETAVQNDEIDDFIILRNDGTPTYMLAVVVDDHDLEVTHILRGDDHLSNTPKQILLDEALGYEIPQFGHLPLILGQDKKRLSKRHGATAIGEYQELGYVPEAMVNYLALLGWSPGDDREMMSGEELIDAFDVTRILKKSAVFDEEKLRWLNGKYLRSLSDDELFDRLRPYVPGHLHDIDERYLLSIIPLMRERMFRLPDLFSQGAYFFTDPESFDEKGLRKHWTSERVMELEKMIPQLEASEFSAEVLERVVRVHAEAIGASAGALIHPLRLALTGGTSSPSLFEMMAVLGKETCMRRLQKAMEVLPKTM